MAIRPNPYLIDDDCPEWTDEQLANPLKAHDIFTPDQLLGLRRLRGQRGEQKLPTKIGIFIRLDADIVEKFKATGTGWQSRMNESLKQAMPA